MYSAFNIEIYAENHILCFSSYLIQPVPLPPIDGVEVVLLVDGHIPTRGHCWVTVVPMFTPILTILPHSACQLHGSIGPPVSARKLGIEVMQYILQNLVVFLQNFN